MFVVLVVVIVVVFWLCFAVLLVALVVVFLLLSLFLVFFFQSSFLFSFLLFLLLSFMSVADARLLLVHTAKDGLLVHCISGWDRTPLFVSLLRISLWAVSSFL